MIRLDEATKAIADFIGDKQHYDLEPLTIRRLAVKYGQPSETVQDLLDTIRSLVYTPLELTAIIHVRRVLNILVEEILSSVADNEAEVVQDILSDFFAVLEGCYADSPMRKGKIYYKKDPFYKCYLEMFASADSISKEDREDCFRFFCRLIARAMRLEHVSKHSTSTQSNYGLAIRVFIRYLPAVIKQARAYIYSKSKLEEYINAAITHFDVQKLKNETGTLTNIAERYIVELKRSFLVEGRFGKGRIVALELVETSTRKPFVFDTESPTGGEDDRGSERHWIPPAVPGLRVKVRLPHDVDDPIDGEEAVPEDLFFPGGDAASASLPKPPRLDFRLADSLHLRYFKFFFDMQFLNLSHFSKLHLYVHEHWNSATPQLQATMTASLLSLHTGSDPSVVANLGIAASEETVDLDKHDLVIVRTDDAFILYRRTVIVRKRKSEEIFNFEISSTVRYTIPAFLGYYLLNSKLNITKPGYVFGEPPDFERLIINIDTIKAFLGRVNKKHSLDITPSRLAGSFFPMYSGRCGLDPLITCYVSGDEMMMHSAALHYVRIRASSLDESYLSAARMVAEKISKNMQKMIEYKLLPESQALEHLQSILSFEQISLAGGKTIVYGSPFAAEADDVRRFVEDIKTHICRPRWINIVERHNLYTCYLYLCLQFSFAHRPRNVIAYALASLTSGSHAVIADKLSRVYREERLLPVNDVLAKLCQNYNDGQTAVLEHIARKIRPELTIEPKPGPLSFITEAGRWRKFNISNFRTELKKAGLPYRFDNKMPRHFVRTRLSEKGYSSDFANAVLGHHHVAREPLSICSSMQYQAFAAAFIVFITDVFHAIGFEPLRYHPGQVCEN